ncbi:hypothetical protein [Pantoea phage LIMEzero]|uniref:Uncharacterized protein n=1 Tax=Pantoea phage LIMEzero TaxID=943335 RepID=F4N9U0_9CAUD|nr:virion structural protein [Pantoea phage LIMEzero]CBY88568.1 hypothetical protein [Pantoea phage LIMEzero]
MGGISNAFKGLGSVFGIGNQNPSYTIGTDPESVKAQTAQANMTADLSQENTPDIVSGGSDSSSTSGALASRRRKSTSGVASNLGIGG